MIIVLTECAVKLSRLQVNDTLLGVEPCWDVSIISVLIIAPYFKMQMRKCGVAGIAAKTDQLSVGYGISNLYQHTIFSKMPVLGNGTILMLNENIITIRQVLLFQPSFIRITPGACYNTVSGCKNFSTAFYFEIKRLASFVAEHTFITLHYKNFLAGCKRKGINKTAVMPCFVPGRIIIPVPRSAGGYYHQ